jgi:hypothetical protein
LFLRCGNQWGPKGSYSRLVSHGPNSPCVFSGSWLQIKGLSLPSLNSEHP